LVRIEAKRGGRTFIVSDGLVDVDADILYNQPADVQPPFHRRQHERAVPDAAFVLDDGRHLYGRAPHFHITVKLRNK
jgi:hypothetical protein